MSTVGIIIKRIGILLIFWSVNVYAADSKYDVLIFKKINFESTWNKNPEDSISDIEMIRKSFYKNLRNQSFSDEWRELIRTEKIEVCMEFGFQKDVHKVEIIDKSNSFFDFLSKDTDSSFSSTHSSTTTEDNTVYAHRSTAQKNDNLIYAEKKSSQSSRKVTETVSSWADSYYRHDLEKGDVSIDLVSRYYLKQSVVCKKAQVYFKSFLQEMIAVEDLQKIQADVILKKLSNKSRDKLARKLNNILSFLTSIEKNTKLPISTDQRVSTVSLARIFPSLLTNSITDRRGSGSTVSVDQAERFILNFSSELGFLVLSLFSDYHRYVEMHSSDTRSINYLNGLILDIYDHVNSLGNDSSINVYLNENKYQVLSIAKSQILKDLFGSIKR